MAGIQILLAQPNPDDPLMTDITDEYRTDYARFVQKATDWTLKHAISDTFDASRVVVAAAQAEAPPPEDTTKQAVNVSNSSLRNDTRGFVKCIEIRDKIAVKKLKL